MVALPRLRESDKRFFNIELWLVAHRCLQGVRLMYSAAGIRLRHLTEKADVRSQKEAESEPMSIVCV